MCRHSKIQREHAGHKANLLQHHGILPDELQSPSATLTTSPFLFPYSFLLSLSYTIIIHGLKQIEMTLNVINVKESETDNLSQTLSITT